ncbi:MULTISPECIES: helix-turn-helix transcriptional regulator [Enterobacteriaceae]|uniref:helix-turn-helix transcriptional regulator n=1 Tax=Enterobacteriaceae TaxID=543 RepID=UPI000E2D2AA4|nr:Excl1 protein [Klebsiella pneumoniae]SWR32097.1 Excl1 protein [Klebsiella pneumoniae]
MANVSISEAARLTGKSRTTLHRLIKAGELSTCRGERNAKMLRLQSFCGCLVPLRPYPLNRRKNRSVDSVTQSLLTVMNRLFTF